MHVCTVKWVCELNFAFICVIPGAATCVGISGCKSDDAALKTYEWLNKFNPLHPISLSVPGEASSCLSVCRC